MSWDLMESSTSSWTSNVSSGSLTRCATCMIPWPSPRQSSFCNTEQKVDWLTQKLRDAHFAGVASVHSGMPQKERDAMLKQFRSGVSRVLISSDQGLPRGLDLPQVALVICYDPPNNREVYIQRIGHLGFVPFRFGRRGVAMNLVKYDEIFILRDIERFCSIQIDELLMPLNCVANLI